MDAFVYVILGALIAVVIFAILMPRRWPGGGGGWRPVPHWYYSPYYAHGGGANTGMLY